MIVLGFFWCLTRLAYRLQISLGKGLGRLIFKRYKKARKIITANVDVCYPGLSAEEKTQFVKEAALELGVSVAETFLIWFRNNKKFLSGRYTVSGIEHYQEALAQTKGIILLSCHYGCVDVNGALLSNLGRGQRSFVGTYRKTDDFVNRFLKHVRSKYCDRLFSAADQRNIVKELKKGNIVWYAPDIEVHNKSCEFIDFMGVKASTTTAISRLAKITGASVVPVAHYRINDKPEYQVKIFSALSNFPSGDLFVDTRAMNAAIEEIIMPRPESYWWAIKRFKNRPTGDKSIY